MPKPIIDNNFLQYKTNSTDIKQLSLSQKKLEERSTFKSPELAFREKRPQNYIEQIKNLDIEGYTISEEKMKEMAKKSYSKKGEDVVDKEHQAAIRLATANPRTVPHFKVVCAVFISHV